jgi:hypothetical protein
MFLARSDDFSRLGAETTEVVTTDSKSFSEKLYILPKSRIAPTIQKENPAKFGSLHRADHSAYFFTNAFL